MDLVAAPGAISNQRFLKRAQTGTPVQELRLTRLGFAANAWLKLEQYNPTGSIKYRTALGLLGALDAAEPLRPGSRVVESTSGNLGIALAALLREMDCEFIAVVDPKLPPQIGAALREAGATLHEVTRRDEHGGFLQSRLAEVRSMLDRDPALRWTDQYSNLANPDVHHCSIAREIVEQVGPRTDAVFVAVSTGGTLAGISRGVRAALPGTAMYAVDAHGSLVTADRGAPHLLNGIGASRKSSFLEPDSFDRAVRVRDVEAFAFCRMLLQDTGLAVGGSGGAALAAFASVAGADADLPRQPVLVIPDGGGFYQSTIYDDAWLAEHKVLDEVREIIDAERADDLFFDLEPSGGTHG